MEVARSPGRLVPIYKITLCHTPTDCNIYQIDYILFRQYDDRSTGRTTDKHQFDSRQAQKYLSAALELPLGHALPPIQYVKGDISSWVKPLRGTNLTIEFHVVLTLRRSGATDSYTMEGSEITYRRNFIFILFFNFVILLKWMVVYETPYPSPSSHSCSDVASTGKT
jgi:hypothetical protein